MMRKAQTLWVSTAIGVGVCLGITGCGGGGGNPTARDDEDIQSTQRATINLPVTGGTLKLENVAEVVFPPNAFPEPRTVTLYTDTTRMSETQFVEQTVLYDAAMPLEYEVRLRVGKTPPLERDDANIAVDLFIPASYTPPPDFDLQAFALVEEAVYGNNAVMSRMRPINCEWNPQTRRLRIYAPVWMFTSIPTGGKAYELVLRVASTPGERIIDGSPTRNGGQTYPCVPRTGCGVDPVGSPIGESGTNRPLDPAELKVHPNGHYNPCGKGRSGSDRKHFGLDLVHPLNTPVLAVADGVVEKIAFEGPTVAGAGFGHYIIIKHRDGSKSLYAHLNERPNLAVGDPVSAGQVIGKVGNTGGPGVGIHLHFEYAPNGILRVDDKANGNQGKWGNVDPLPCIQGERVDAQIKIGDNGPAPDDAFEVSILRASDGKLLYSATTRTISEETRFYDIALANLRPGRYIIRVKCIDDGDNGGDVGTLGVSLVYGIRFENHFGSIYSAELDLGETIEISIIVDSATRSRSALPPIPLNSSSRERK